MKKLLIFSAMLLSACLQKTAFSEIPNTGFSLPLPENAEIEVMPLSSTNYQLGMRTYISSHSSQQFLELLGRGQTNMFYYFHIYEPSEGTLNYSEWVEENCSYKDAGIKRIHTGSVIVLQAGDQCSRGRTFGVFTNNQAYKIQAGTDAMNYELIWELLKTARPASE